MTPFDLHHAPLEGTHLIEAGAGTGKTYAIAGLFLRLVVELGLGVDQILVVTYTKAATDELKTRIRQRLTGARAAFAAGRSEEPLLATLINRMVDKTQAAARLREALLNFDRAAIYTIHGFCQRLLQNFAFETGHLFRSDLMADPLSLVQEAADDFWRRYITRAPHEIAGVVLAKLKGPEQFARLYQRARSSAIRIVPPPEKPELSALRPFRRAAAQVSQLWPQVRGTIVQALRFPGLNARLYGKCEEMEGQTGVNPRIQYVNALAAALDRWPGYYPLFSHFARFCAGYLAKATKKNHPVPEHPFFDLCQTAWDLHQELEKQLDSYLVYLKGKFLQQAHRRLAHKKELLNVLFFDDLLRLVQEALARKTGLRAAAEIRKCYKAALVDEFQDTDPLQYDIFQRLFTSGQGVFFLIGDPKQAIYGFRGADLYAYLAAARDMGAKSTLTRNWRSTPRLIQAVNAVFGRHPQPFGLEQIEYHNTTAAMEKDEEDQAALTLWYLLPSTEDRGGKPVSKHEAEQRISAAVAQEIAGLLKGADGRSPAAPEQIAVLTRSHSQAKVIKAALALNRVPAVLYSAGSVFETQEARELTLVLRAAAAPSDPRCVRSALATEMLGARGMDFITMEDAASQASWEVRWERFAGYHQAWLKDGFHTLFSRLMQQEGVRQRLLPLADGERRITNLLHLAELLHQAATTLRLGPEALLNWFENQQALNNAGEEARQLRLESDAHAVRILTIHKSKGLQFDMVFCPFTWAGASVSQEGMTFHDPGQDNRLTLDLGPKQAPEHLHQSLLELLAENLRLLYVALTRARTRCYWAWGRINNTELSAPAYLLHDKGAAAMAADWINSAKQTMAALGNAAFVRDLERLQQSAPEAIALAPLPAVHLPEPEQTAHAPEEPIQGRCRSFRRTLDRQWRITSFSSLTSGRHGGGEEHPDRDQLWSLETDLTAEAPPTLFNFPGGARAGLFFHDLLEHCDFTCQDPAVRRLLVGEKLDAHGYDDLWRPAVEQLLIDLAAVRLPDAAGSGFRLDQVSGNARINEMDFHFPLKQLRPGPLQQLVARQGGTPRLKELPPLHGYMKGFIDVVLRHNQRYYLLDWKSNFLGSRPEDYAPDRLADAMDQANYTLQYLIYTAALDKYLRSRLPGYDYTRHFGGVYYIFLRGIQPGAETQSGIFHTLPEPAVVEALHEALGSREGGPGR